MKIEQKKNKNRKKIYKNGTKKKYKNKTKKKYIKTKASQFIRHGKRFSRKFQHI